MVNHILFIPPSFCVCQSFSTDALLACKYLETLFPSSLGDSEVVRILISLFWTLPEQLSMLHPTCEPTHLEPMSQDTLQTSTQKKSSHTSLFWTLPEQITPHMGANPEPMLQRYTTKPQTPRFSSHTSLFWTLAEQLPILHHACEPTHPEPMSQDTLQASDPNFFISHIPVLNFAGTTRNRLHHACVRTHPEPTSQDTPQNLRRQDFHLTHPSFELCQSSSPYYTTHVSQPILNQRPKTHYKLQIRIFFISHIPVLNFAGTACHVTPRMWANPSCTNVPRYNTND